MIGLFTLIFWVHVFKISLLSLLKEHSESSLSQTFIISIVSIDWGFYFNFLGTGFENLLAIILQRALTIDTDTSLSQTFIINIVSIYRGFYFNFLGTRFQNLLAIIV